MKLNFVPLFVVSFFCLNAHAEPQNFIAAAREFSVPAPLLYAIAEVETHAQQVVVDGVDGEHAPLFGIMGLRGDPWFGQSLKKAAELLKLQPKTLKTSEKENIRGGAAYLQSLAKSHHLSLSLSDLYSWVPAVRSYSGIPTEAEADEYVYDVYTMLKNNGYSVDPDTAVPTMKAHRLAAATNNASDYPAATWSASPNFNAGGMQIKYVVIHVTEGAYAGSLSWLKNPAAQVSSHYLLRSSDGFVSQLVHESDTAWHALCWNPYAIGIEHEGYSANSTYFTAPLYSSSAALVKYLLKKYQIPLDNVHVIGHDFWSTPAYKGSPISSLGSCNNHVDPGNFWDWTGFFKLLQ